MKRSYNPIRERKPKGKRKYSPSQEISLAPQLPRNVEMYLDDKMLADAIETAEAVYIEFDDEDDLP